VVRLTIMNIKSNEVFFHLTIKQKLLGNTIKSKVWTNNLVLAKGIILFKSARLLSSYRYTLTMTTNRLLCIKCFPSSSLLLRRQYATSTSFRPIVCSVICYLFGYDMLVNHSNPVTMESLTCPLSYFHSQHCL
jgi:hypothetical protein